MDDDLTSDEGLAKALAAVSDPAFHVLLFGALPCTGGSQWQRMNWKRGPGTQDKIRGHWEVFESFFKNFEKVAAACALTKRRPYRRRMATKLFVLVANERVQFLTPLRPC